MHYAHLRVFWRFWYSESWSSPSLPSIPGDEVSILLPLFFLYITAKAIYLLPLIFPLPSNPDHRSHPRQIPTCTPLWLSRASALDLSHSIISATLVTWSPRCNFPSYVILQTLSTHFADVAVWDSDLVLFVYSPSPSPPYCFISGSMQYLEFWYHLFKRWNRVIVFYRCTFFTS